MEKKVQACKASQICLACGREKFSPEHYKICKGKDNPYYCKECKMNNAFCKHTPAMVVERINYNQHGELIDCDIEYWRHDAISIESLAELNR